MIELAAHSQGTVISIRAQPGARQNAVLGERAGALRVAVSAAPEQGKANAAIANVLAEALGCRPSQVGLLSGATSRAKKFLIAGLSADELRPRIDALVNRLSP